MLSACRQGRPSDTRSSPRAPAPLAGAPQFRPRPLAGEISPALGARESGLGPADWTLTIPSQKEAAAVLGVLHAAWEAVRVVAWGLTWALYAVYVTACLGMALGIAALVVSMGLACIPDRAGPKFADEDLEPPA